MSLRPRAPAPCAAAACCASSPSFGGDRLAAVLATGMRLGPTPPAPTGVVLESQDRLAQCAICLEPMFSEVSEDNPFIILKCDHAFHVDCLATWVQRSSGCPTCRKTITQTDENDIDRYAISVDVDGRVTRNGRYLNTLHWNDDGSLAKIDYPGRTFEIYEGGVGQERLVYTLFPDGKKFYAGERGMEYLYRIQYIIDGSDHMYVGPAGEESLDRIEFPSGKVQFYKGEKRKERHVKTKLPNGKVLVYEGEKGTEHKVRTEYPDGKKEFYKGNKGAEYMVRVEYPDGNVVLYEGEKGVERPVQSRPGDSGTKRLRLAALAGGTRLVEKQP